MVGAIASLSSSHASLRTKLVTEVLSFILFVLLFHLPAHANALHDTVCQDEHKVIKS
jgi:hypothetical protein